jgi:hypothetical protein
VMAMGSSIDLNTARHLLPILAQVLITGAISQKELAHFSPMNMLCREGL